MKRVYLFLALVTTLSVLALGISTAVARPAGDTPPFPTYSSTIYPCKYDYAKAREWEADDTGHVRNAVLTTYGATDDLKFVYKTTENLNWNFNKKKMEGNLWGTITAEYTDKYGKVGLWVGRIEGRLYIDSSGVPLAKGKGVFDGQELFEGLRMKITWEQDTHFDQPALACIGHEPQGEHERPPLPVKTLIDHYVIETTGVWPPGE